MASFHLFYNYLSEHIYCKKTSRVFPAVNAKHVVLLYTLSPRKKETFL